MPRCDCGALTGRYKVHVESPDGKPIAQLYTSCPMCHPEEFPAEAYSPLDRLVSGPEAMPNRYRRDSEGVYHPTDELMADTQAIICTEGPTERAIRIKRETRRTTPMTEEEIKEADRIWRNRLQTN